MNSKVCFSKVIMLQFSFYIYSRVAVIINYKREQQRMNIIEFVKKNDTTKCQMLSDPSMN